MGRKEDLEYRDSVNQKLFEVMFRLIPKENEGRCISCHANNLCGTKISCNATMDEQYEQTNPSLQEIFK